MKILSIILIVLNSILVLGQKELNSLFSHEQTELRGTLKSYEDGLVLPFANICIDTYDSFKGSSYYRYPPMEETNTNEKGNFSITTKLSGKVSLHALYIDYVTLTIKNIEIEKNKNVIDLGIIYLPYRGQWGEGYKPPKGKTKKEARKSRKDWRKEGLINCSGFSPDFFEPYKGMDTIYLEYPLNGTKKEFQIKGESLIIDYKEFIKE